MAVVYEAGDVFMIDEPTALDRSQTCFDLAYKPRIVVEHAFNCFADAGLAVTTFLRGLVVKLGLQFRRHILGQTDASSSHNATIGN
jgi:hypothetical protein